jgi:hypothetical protein
MQGRFKMSFGNDNFRVARQQALASYQANISDIPNRKNPTLLNAPMIDRVYRAKPGCSACGKKVT